MATYDPAAVRAALKALLQTCSTVASANVYDSRKTNIDGYPAIIFDLTNESGTMLDEITNVRVLTFTIWVVVEVSVAGQATAGATLDACVKEVVNLLEKASNAELSGTVDWTMPAVGQRDEVATPEGNTLYQEIKLQCNVSSTLL